MLLEKCNQILNWYYSIFLNYNNKKSTCKAGYSSESVCEQRCLDLVRQDEDLKLDT